VPSGSIATATFAPTVTAINTTVVNVPVGQLGLNGPQIYIDGYQYPFGQLTMTGYAPNVLATGVFRTVWDATMKIVNAGLIVDQITWITSNSVPYGYVISQSPDIGTVVAPWTSVKLVASSGLVNTVATVTVPPVVGLLPYPAQQALAQAGLDVGPAVYGYSATVPIGTVMTQSIAGGTVVNAGTIVSLTVSSGPAPVSSTVVVP
jgi:hypothetical protein